MKGSIGTSTGMTKLSNPKKKKKRVGLKTWKVAEATPCKWCKTDIEKGGNAYGKRTAPMHHRCFVKFRKWLSN